MGDAMEWPGGCNYRIEIDDQRARCDWFGAVVGQAGCRHCLATRTSPDTPPETLGATSKTTPALVQSYADRIAICETCEHYRPWLSQCTRCGCFLALKARLVSQHCPVGKW